MPGYGHHVHGPHDHEPEHPAQHGDKGSFAGMRAVMTAILPTMGGATRANAALLKNNAAIKKTEASNQRNDHQAKSSQQNLAALVLALTGAWAAPAAAASFDCTKASTRVETTVCRDAELSTLDDHLARYYAAARQALGDGAPCLQAGQRQWLQATRNACADAACLRQAYLRRLAELHPLQPGASALRNLDLPAVPGLVWVIPPAKDQVAAPPRPRLPALTVRGRIVNDVNQGDGYVIRSAEGRSHTLLPLMFLDGPSVDRLAVLAQDKAAVYEAQGQTEAAPGQTAHFAPGQCTALYRLPP